MELHIPQHVNDNIMYWVNKAEGEVSGFGKVTYDEAAKTITVTNVYLIEQEVGAAHTDIDAKALGKLLYKTHKVPGDLRFWWHSHVNMNTFWSGTDTDTIRDLAKPGWIVATVFNKKHELRSALAYAVEGKFGSSVTIEDNLPTFILHDAKSMKAWDKEFDACVKTKTYTNNYTPHTSAKSPMVGDGQGNLVHYTDAEFTDEWGWYGMGLAKEAAILGMKPKAYKDLLDAGSQTSLDWIDNRLGRYIEEHPKEKEGLLDGPFKLD